MTAHVDAVAPIVLLHPFPFDSRLWLGVQEELTEQGYFVIAPNFRGCGKAELGDGEPDLELLAQDVWKLLDLQGLSNPIIIGISLGGYVAMSMLRQRPDAIAGLGLVDTKATADSTEARATRIATAESMVSETAVKEISKVMLPRLLSEFTQTHRQPVTQQVRDLIHESNPKTIAWLQLAMAHRPSSLAQLSKFTGPVLLMRGSEDQVCDAQDYADMMAVLPDASYIEIPNAAHLPPIEDPGATTIAIAQWLNESFAKKD